MCFCNQLIGLLALSITWTSVVIGEQRFVETPANYQEVPSGEDVELRCRVQDKRGQCIWQKDRKPVGMHPDKYEWSVARDSPNSPNSPNSGGDCTLLIRRASLDFDDGLWECQVTPGDFTRQDALTSLPSRLLVRVKPRAPRLEFGGGLLNSPLTLREGQEVTISCVSKYGNPAALIKWYIGNKEVEALRGQTNATEVDNPKTWAAHSLLRVRARREIHALPIRCITIHPSSPVPAVAEVRLDVHYSPDVRVETSPRVLPSMPEDSTSFMGLKCFADGNPAATVTWFKDSLAIESINAAADANILPLEQNRTRPNNTVTVSELRFEPVKRDDAGLYACKAFNAIGESSPANYRLDVQYGPKLKVASNDSSRDSPMDVERTTVLGSTSESVFECAEFEANPPAQYRWTHLRGSADRDSKTVDNTGERRLHLKNVSWSDDGEYRCIAFNVINGVRREMPSAVRYILHVTGPPQIQSQQASSIGKKGFYESIGWAGEPFHLLKFRFCSRPTPRLVAWQWGSSHLRTGESIPPKFEALPLEPINENKFSNNCYWAKLMIKNLRKEDARIYSLLVASEKGEDSARVKLLVRDATELRVIAAAAAVGLLFILLFVSVAVYFLLRLKNHRYRREEEEGSIAADNTFASNGKSLEPRKSADSSANTPFVPRSSQDLSGVYDYQQMAKHTRTISPEALKVRRAPAVLQPPTIV